MWDAMRSYEIDLTRLESCMNHLSYLLHTEQRHSDATLAAAWQRARRMGLNGYADQLAQVLERRIRQNMAMDATEAA